MIEDFTNCRTEGPSWCAFTGDEFFIKGRGKVFIVEMTPPVHRDRVSAKIGAPIRYRGQAYLIKGVEMFLHNREHDKVGLLVEPLETT